MKLSRLAIGTQYSLLLGAFLGSVAFAGITVGSSVITAQATNEARSIADFVEHVGKWASKYKGVWVQSGAGGINPGTHLKRLEYNTTLSSGDIEMLAYHWKNPALIQREISDIAAQSKAPVKFRMTAKSVFNPDNAPTEFEKWALQKVSAEKGPDEVSQVNGNNVLYARRVMVTAGCIACHGAFEKAPAFMKEKYPTLNGYGYKEGETAGVISVTVPMPTFGTAITNSMTQTGWLAVGTVAASFAALLAFVYFGVISPVNRVRRMAERISQTQVGKDFTVPALPQSHINSDNEIHRLSVSITSLGNSVRLLYRKISRTQQAKQIGDSQPGQS